MSGPGFWDRHGFVLVGADAVRRGLAAGLLRRLGQEGFVPVAGRVVATDPEMIDDLYADLIAGQWQTWRYRLVDAAFRLGPAIAVICRFDVDRDRPYDLLQERKGHQHPDRAAPGTIRRDLAAINAVLNLLHTADGPEESAREARVFGLTERDAPPERAAERTPERAAERTLLTYLCGLTQPPLPEQRDFARTLAGVRARVLAAAWPSLPGRVRHAVVADFPEPPMLSLTSAGDRLAAALTGVLPDDLVEILRCDFTPQWRDRVRLGRAAALLRRHGVVLDDWEELVLMTSLQFPPWWEEWDGKPGDGAGDAMP